MRGLKFGDFGGVVQLICRPMTTEQKNKQFVTWDFSLPQMMTKVTGMESKQRQANQPFRWDQAGVR